MKKNNTKSHALVIRLFWRWRIVFFKKAPWW